MTGAPVEVPLDSLHNAILSHTQDSRMAGRAFIVLARYEGHVEFFPKNFTTHRPHPVRNEALAKLFIDGLLAIGYGRYWRDQFLPKHAEVFVRVVPVPPRDFPAEISHSQDRRRK